ncbi:MAG TPA: hypothetical protein VHJ57_03525, partial [Nitrososphaeraceae archaeon]|nr:hypothetical protein [Nitrososphaeraceae archaeon]
MNFKNTVLFSGVAVLLSFLILNSVTYSFSFAATEYEHKTKWGTKGVAIGQFSQTGGITADSENNIYVADFTGRSNMIQKFSGNGSFILGFGVLGNGPQFFTNPSGLTADSENNIYIADFGNPTYAIKKFSKDGNFIDTFGSFGLGDGEFITPGGLGVD